MTEEGWNHNTHYHERLLDALPRRCGRALDVGCGRGAFTRRLARVASHVDAIDRDPGTLAHAGTASRSTPNITFIAGDFISWQPPHRYDVVAMIATLHHLPFETALAKAARLLEPGGTLLVLGLDRAPSFTARVVQAVCAYPVSWWFRLMRKTAAVGAPIREPEMTFTEISAGAQRLIPGAVLRRHLLWRYSLVWTKSLP